MSHSTQNRSFRRRSSRSISWLLLAVQHEFAYIGLQCHLNKYIFNNNNNIVCNIGLQLLIPDISPANRETALTQRSVQFATNSTIISAGTQLCLPAFSSWVNPGWAEYYPEIELLRTIEAGVFTNRILFLSLKTLKGIRISVRSQKQGSAVADN